MMNRYGEKSTYLEKKCQQNMLNLFFRKDATISAFIKLSWLEVYP